MLFSRFITGLSDMSLEDEYDSLHCIPRCIDGVGSVHSYNHQIGVPPGTQHICHLCSLSISQFQLIHFCKQHVHERCLPICDACFKLSFPDFFSLHNTNPSVHFFSLLSYEEAKREICRLRSIITDLRDANSGLQSQLLQSSCNGCLRCGVAKGVKKKKKTLLDYYQTQCS